MIGPDPHGPPELHRIRKGLPAHPLACLDALFQILEDCEHCVGFDPVARHTTLDRAVVRRAVRALTRRGLAYYAKGLCNDDGDFAGACYGLTELGQLVAMQKGMEEQHV